MKNILFLSVLFSLFITGATAQTNSENETAKSEPKTVTLKVTGMTCGGCANTIHSALSKKDGVLGNEVQYPGNVATVKYDPEKITEQEIIATIEKAGYKAEVITDNNEKPQGNIKSGKKSKGCAPVCGGRM